MCGNGSRTREHYYGDSPVANPGGPDNRTTRLLRGGSWDYGPWDLRVASRAAHGPDTRDVNIGFRCAREVSKRAGTWGQVLGARSSLQQSESATGA